MPRWERNMLFKPMTCNHSTYKITNNNDKSTRLIDLANGIGDRITNIMFAHKNIHKGT